MPGRDDSPELVVDALGLLCPLPILRTENAIGRVRSGGLLALRADDEGVREDLPSWCQGNGHELVSITQLAPTAVTPSSKPELYCLVRKARQTASRGGQ